jgi:hypothetical protein
VNRFLMSSIDMAALLKANPGGGSGPGCGARTDRVFAAGPGVFRRRGGFFAAARYGLVIDVVPIIR